MNASSRWLVALMVWLPFAAVTQEAPAPSKIYRYHPTFRVPPSLESVYRRLTAGGDAFPEEKAAEALGVRLGEMSARLRQRASAAADLSDWLAPDFRGGRLTSPDEVRVGAGARLEILRARAMPAEAMLDRTSFRREIETLVNDFASIDVAEFLITAIDVPSGPAPLARTTVRFDLAGPAKSGGRAERIGRWRLHWRGDAARGWGVSEWTSLDYARSHASAPMFTESTAAAFGHLPSFQAQLVPGLDEWSRRLDGVFKPGGMGHHGVSVADFDGDGDDDLYVSQPEGLPNRLFRNRGNGGFEDVTAASGVDVLDRTSQSLAADVDNDGDEDLILLTRTGPLLFVNDGKGRFARDAEAFHFEQPLKGSLTSGALADYDRDGFLDLYLCAYGYFIGVGEDKAGPPSPYHDAQNGSPNVLFRNDGHGRFVEVTSVVGLQEHNDRFSFAPAWADYDEDGWPDLLVANDFGRKNLYRHQGMAGGRPRFKDEAGAAGVEDYGAGMSAAFLDYDNDGHLDIYTGNMWTAAGQRVTAAPGFKPEAPAEVRDIYRRHARGNSLFRNRGDGTFADVTIDARAEFGRWAWSSDTLDFDNDGWDDLYVVNGMFTRAADESSVDVDSFFWREVVAQSPLTRTPGTPYDDGWRATNRLLVSRGAQAQHERHVLLRNDGHGGFDEISGVSGLDVAQDGRAFGIFDYDGDGDSDVVTMAPRSSPQLRLFRNDVAAGHAAIALRLIGTKSNRDAIGARVTVEAGGQRVTKLLSAGSGFLSQHSKQLLFGLGGSQRIATVMIAWPSGVVQTLSDLPVNHRVWIEEGRGSVRSEPFRNASAAAAPAAPAPTRTAAGRDRPGAGIWLYRPAPAPDFSLRDLAGQPQSLSSAGGRPTLVLFWATWAPPSGAALDALSHARASLARAGVSILALSVDSLEDEPKVRAAAQRLDVPVMMAGEKVAGVYTILHRYLFDRQEDLPLPTAFLVDARREIVKVYRDPIDVARIAADIPAIDVPAQERLVRAVPFPGTSYSNVGERSEFQYGLELSEQGFDEPALAVFERVAARDPSAITFYNLGTLYMNGGQPQKAKAAFTRALELEPDDAEANNSFGALLAHSGDIPGAIDRFRAAVRARPDFADALNNLGFALFQTGQPDQAFDLYQQALKHRPDFPEALNNVGIFFGRQGDLDRALSYFQQAVDRRAGYGDAANNLALVLAARGESEKAIAVLQRLMKENPSFEMAYVTLARIYLQAGRRQNGLQVLQDLLQRNPTHPLGLQMLRQIQAGG